MTTTTTTELPPGRYTVDTEHSSIGFVAKVVLGIRARGRFERFESVVDIGASAAESSMTLTVWTDSIRTGIKKRDQHLRADNVLGVEDFPTMEFRSTGIVEGESGYDVEGVLRVRDVSQPVAFHAAPVPQAGPARYTAELTLTPGEFGVRRRGTTGALVVHLDVTLTPHRPQA